MKRFIAFAILLLCAATAYPQNTEQTVPDYGTRVTIEPGFTTTLDRSYLNAGYYDARGSFGGTVSSITSMVWHPDGKRVAYIDAYRKSIMMVPVEGGTPQMIFESYYLYSFEETIYILGQHIDFLIGFSPDGEKLYFTREEIDPSNGSIIKINHEGGGTGIEVDFTTYVLQCLDLKTGTVETIARNAYYGVLSPSKRYLLYTDKDQKTKVKELISGATWEIPVPEVTAYCFSSDEQSILFFQETSEGAPLFRIPLKGGDPVQVTPASGLSRQFPDCSPDGGWVVFTEFGETVTDASGTPRITSISAVSPRTGELIEILPYTEFTIYNMSRFSPDGKRICYIRCDYADGQQHWYLSVKNISLPASGSDGQVSVTVAAPKGFALTGNYPNPFNPSTHIAFTLPSSGTAQLSVYDVTGRKVRDLVSSTLTAGAHEMVWDGRDASGAAVSSGTYIARLKMGSFTASHRMMLMK